MPAAPSDPALVAPGVLCGRLPIDGGTSRTECEATRIAVVRVTAANTGMAAALESIIIDHVNNWDRHGPVRMSYTDAGLLIPFRMEVSSRSSVAKVLAGLQMPVSTSAGARRWK